MQRLRETFRRQRQSTLEQKAQQHHQQIVQQQQQQHQNQQQQQQQKLDETEPESKSVQLQQIKLEFNQPTYYLLIPKDAQIHSSEQDNRTDDLLHSNLKQIRSASYDEIRMRESQAINDHDSSLGGDPNNQNQLDIPGNSRNIRSRSFDSATASPGHAVPNQVQAVPTPTSSSFLDVPKWKLLIRRSSSGSSSNTSSGSGFTPAKDCVHCQLMDEYYKLNAQMSPPPSSMAAHHGSFSSESGSTHSLSTFPDDSDRDADAEASEGSPVGSTGSAGSGADADDVPPEDEDDLIVPLEGLPVVTLCPPPPPAEVHESHLLIEEEDSGSGITVVSLEVPILTGSKQVRSASVDSPYLLQVPKRTDIGDGEMPPKACRSRSVDIVLPTTVGGPYLIVPPHRQTQTQKKAIQGEIKISTENGETRTLRSAPDWGESAINGDHLWVSTSASGDLCYVGESECSKQGPRLCCPSCKITAHTGCIGILIDKIKFHCKPMFKDVGVRQYREQTVIHHHWVHRRHQKGRCKQCGKSFQSKLSFGNKEIVAISCSWCKTAYHNKETCFNMQRIGESCHLGIHSDLIVPPSWIVKLPRRGSFKSSIRRSPKNKRASSKKRTKKDEIGGCGPGTDNHLHHHHHHLHGSSPPPVTGRELVAGIGAGITGQHRSFAIKPIPSLTSKPLLVFINPKSGGNQGSKLMQKFQWLLNPRQVFDMSQGGPKPGIELYKKVNNMRILACGGDGTVGWILSVLDELNVIPTPPVGVLPLGTGNDLARALGWGGGYTDEPISKILLNVRDGEVIQLDRWDLKVTKNVVSPSFSGQQEPDSEGAKDDLPINVCNNYFSIGVDAHIALEFHEAREAHPERFNSRLRNKTFYCQAGGKDLLQRKWKDLCNYITLECDGQDLTQRLKELKVHSVLFLNIPSYSGGTRPWGSNSPSYEIPRTDDGLIEVIGLTTYQLPLLQAGGHGSCIAQCKSAKIITTRTIPMQVDGEPCRLLPSVITLQRRNQANLIAKAKSHNQIIHVPTMEKITLKVRKLNLIDYETYHYDKDKLKEVSTVVGRLCIDQNLELVHVRTKINELLQEQAEATSIVSSSDGGSATSKLSIDWCFVDSCTAERFFRIDRAQEHLHFAVDICTDDLFILDPETPGSGDDNKDDVESVLFEVPPVVSPNGTACRTPEKRPDGVACNPVKVPSRFTSDEVILAAKVGDLGMLKQLHHRGVSLTQADQFGMTALHYAARMGNENVVGFLLSTAPKNLVNISDSEYGQTALHKAAHHRRHNICSMLASCGAELAKLDHKGMTARQLASAAGDDELAKYLERFEEFQNLGDKETEV